MGIPVMISEIWYNSRFILQQRSRRRAGTEVGMANALRQSLDPKAFLAEGGEARIIGRYHPNEIIYAQGELAEAVFYIQDGKVKVTVVSDQGKEAVVSFFGANEFLAKAVWRDRRSACEPSKP